MALYYGWFEGPMGRRIAVAAGEAIVRIATELDEPGLEADLARRFAVAAKADGGHPLVRLAIEQLAEYFAGRRREFHLPLAPAGTAFQMRVWQALRAIPYGETRSYGELARAIGSPRAARAVGAANGANPIAIVVPCHRVIQSDGRLGGYGGGRELKQFLLDLEKSVIAARRPDPTAQ